MKASIFEIICSWWCIDAAAAAAGGIIRWGDERSKNNY
jgi:hypothetical protein